MALKPFKAVVKLIAAEHDKSGSIVGEQIVGETVLYDKQFGRELNRRFEQVLAAHAAQEQMQEAAQEPQNRAERRSGAKRGGSAAKRRQKP